MALLGAALLAAGTFADWTVKTAGGTVPADGLDQGGTFALIAAVAGGVAVLARRGRAPARRRAG